MGHNIHMVYIQVPEEHFPWQYDLNLSVAVRAAARADVSGPDTCTEMGGAGEFLFEYKSRLKTPLKDV